MVTVYEQQARASKDIATMYAKGIEEEDIELTIMLKYGFSSKFVHKIYSMLQENELRTRARQQKQQEVTREPVSKEQAEDEADAILGQ